MKENFYESILIEFNSSEFSGYIIQLDKSED